jgi:phage terminase small subunit
MARRKITKGKAVEIEAEKLPDLTESQYAFVLGLLAGKTGADAYRAAYDASAMSSAAVHVAASRLRTNAKVTLWLRASRVAHLGSSTVTLDGHLRELERLRELALKAGNHGAAMQAEIARGKAAGHYVEKYADVSEGDPIATLNEIAATDPELAAKLAKAHGITWNEGKPDASHIH